MKQEVICLPGYDYEFEWVENTYRYGVLQDRFGKGVIEISDTAIFELARKLFPERIKEEYQ